MDVLLLSMFVIIIEFVFRQIHSFKRQFKIKTKFLHNNKNYNILTYYEILTNNSKKNNRFLFWDYLLSMKTTFFCVFKLVEIRLID